MKRIVLLLTAIFICNTAWALDTSFIMPSVEYSADKTMESGDVTVKSRVYYMPKKIREDITMAGMSQTTIIRQDKGLMWMIIHPLKQYTEQKADISNKRLKENVERTVEGSEVVNGMNTTRAKVVITDADGSKYSGHMWTTKESILIKLDVLQVGKPKKEAVRMEFSNVSIAKQDSKLFELPAGYEKSGASQDGGINLQEMMDRFGK